MIVCIRCGKLLTYKVPWCLRERQFYRYDNIPDRRARGLPTFPKHFHEGSEDNIVGRDFGEKPHDVLRNFLSYVREELRRKIT